MRVLILTILLSLIYVSPSFAQSAADFIISRELHGTEHNPNIGWSAITNKNIYKQGDAVKVTVTNQLYEDAYLEQNMWFQLNKNNSWKRRGQILKKRRAKRLRPGQSVKLKWNTKNAAAGKYRLLIFPSKDFSVPPIISNEFYLN